jgi:putative transposase
MFDGELSVSDAAPAPAARGDLTQSVAAARKKPEGAAYNAAELAEMKLPGYPGTKDAMRVRADRENWPSRPRFSVGGGVEYPLATLPIGIQTEINRRQALAALTSAAPVPPAAKSAPAKIVSESAPAPVDMLARALKAGRGKDRLDAHIDILTAYDAYAARREGMSARRAQHAFVGLWNSGQIGDAAARAACPTISSSSLRRWLEARRAGDLARLAGKYGNRKGSGVFDGPLAPLREWIVNTAARQPELSAEQIRKAALGEFGDDVEIIDADGVVTVCKMPSLRRVQAVIKGWRDANPALARRLSDPDGWKNRDMLALGRQDQYVTAPNQVWMIDASPADAHAVDGRRNIYLLIDVFTRQVMVLVTETPRTEACKLLLRRAILEWGVPATLITDNGSDFISREARRVFAALDLAHDPSTAFAPWEKGIVERAIGTLQHGLFPMLPGYCGHNVAAASKIRARKAFSDRLGEVDAAAFSVSLTGDEIAAAIEAWIGDVYHHQPHGGLDGKSPFQVLAGWRGTLRRVADARALDMLLMRAEGVRVVRKKGLRINNRHYWDRNGGLIPFIGSSEALEIRMDPDRRNEAFVYHAEGGEFICRVECLEDLPAAELAAVATEAKAKQRKATAAEVKAVRAGPGAKHQGEVLRLVLADGARRHGGLIAAPKPAETHATAGLAAGAMAAAAAPARTAEVTRLPNAKAAPSRQDDEERWWGRWREIDARLKAGEAVTPAESQWRDTMKEKPFIKARLRFGDGDGAAMTA